MLYLENLPKYILYHLLSVRSVDAVRGQNWIFGGKRDVVIARFHAIADSMELGYLSNGQINMGLKYF